MFELYTEKARRVIFFARYEASQFGQPNIETEHLLLGLLREDKALSNRFLRTSPASVELIRKRIEKSVTIGEKISTSVDLPLSRGSKNVLTYAAEEAQRLEHKHIATEHLFLGLLREEGSLAQVILKEHGLELEKARQELARMAAERPIPPAQLSTLAVQSLTGLYSDLTQKAADGELDPVVARDVELEALIEVLCRKKRRNPMLLGESGAGKSAIVEALAQRIARREVPPSLAQMRLIALSAEALAVLAPNRERFDDLTRLLESVAKSANLILFVDGLRGPTEITKKVPGEGLLGVLKFAMQEEDLLCIGAASEQEYKVVCAALPALDRVFRPLHVKPLNTQNALAALHARKEKLEQFHGLKIADDALGFAVQQANTYSKEKLLPGKALELLDAAAAAAKVREEVRPLPEEIKECRLNLKSIAHRLESAMAAHEFEKVKFYGEEERKERANLDALLVKHGIRDQPALTVTCADLEQVISRWNAYPYKSDDDK